MLMNQFPSVILMLLGLGCATAQLVDAVITGNMVSTMTYLLNFLTQLGMQLYGFMFIVGALTMATEWKHIPCKASKKIWSLFTFPLFMFTYIPISIHAIFAKVGWSPIQHSINRTAEQIRRAA